jgi:hypothetical protein
MPQPSYHAIEWHSPPDLSTREVRSFRSRQERDTFVREAPRGGTEFRLAVSGSEAKATRRSVSRRVIPSLHPAASAPVDPSHPSAEL